MTNRPQPRRSTLAGQTPITPSTEIPSSPARPVPTQERKQKITITINADLADRSRGMYLKQLGNGGPKTWSQWIEEAIRQQLNQSDTTQIHIHPGEIPTGRPVNLDKR